MKKIFKKISVFFFILLISLCLVSCKEDIPTPEPSDVDYVETLKLDMGSETLKQEVTVKNYIDGDTTHFYVPNSVDSSGVLKARYLAINTPESTGKIEEWGKKASKFTKEKLSNATSIMIESDDNKWNLDSTGGRYLVWIWYKTSESSDYRNLNVEILQNGLAIASNSANNRYGEVCVNAINKAKKEKLNIYSGEKDPDFFYGGPIEITLKELRTNIQEYDNVKVSFEGVITRNYNNSIYVEDYDEETDLYFGMTVYLGYNLSGEGLSIVNVGNRSRIVGTVQYYETGKSYQVSGLQYRIMRPNDPDNIKLISEGHEASYTEIDPNDFINSKIKIEVKEDEVKEFAYSDLIMNTSVSMKNLTVKSVYTTTNEDSSSKGAMTLTCEVNGITISIRTVPLYDENNKLITADYYKGKVIDVKGIVDTFDGKCQIKVFSQKDILIH